MDIKTMTDEQKSVILAQLCEWKVIDIGYGDFLIEPPDSVKRISNVYDPAYMDLAWEIRRWFIGYIEKDRDNYLMTDPSPRMFDKWYFWQMGRSASGESRIDETPAAEAQRIWLDKILELAIEAGFIDSTAVPLDGGRP